MFRSPEQKADEQSVGARRTVWQTVFSSVGKSRRAKALVFLCAALTLLTGALFGGDKTKLNDRAESSDHQTSQQPRVLVLKTGQVVHGRFRVVPAGLALSTSAGEIVYPPSDILCVASSLQDAYRQISRLRPNPTPAQRLWLAQWCLQHELYKETERELQLLLSEQPNNQTAQAMLEKLAAVLGESSQSRFSTRAGASSQEENEELKTLGGLPRELARSYMQTIQPLLFNKCGGVGCHSRFSNNPFRLIKMNRSPRMFVERNLAQVLSYIDRLHPEQSRLLLKARDGHGQKRASTGRRTSGLTRRQFELLRRWVLQTAECLPPPSGSVFPSIVRSSATAAPHQRSYTQPTHNGPLSSGPASPPAATPPKPRSSVTAPFGPPTPTPTFKPSNLSAPPHLSSSPSVRSKQPQPVPLQPSSTASPQSGAQPNAPKQPTARQKAADPFSPDFFNRHFAGQNHPVQPLHNKKHGASAELRGRLPKLDSRSQSN